MLAWVVEVVLYAVGAPFRLFPAPLDVRLFDGPLFAVGGMVCITAAVVLFVAALLVPARFSPLPGSPQVPTWASAHEWLWRALVAGFLIASMIRRWA